MLEQVGRREEGERGGAGGWVVHNSMVLKGDVGAVEQWGGWFLLALFGAILTWEEVWDLPNSAALSAWLLLLITAGAMICSWYACFPPFFSVCTCHDIGPCTCHGVGPTKPKAKFLRDSRSLGELLTYQAALYLGCCHGCAYCKALHIQAPLP